MDVAAAFPSVARGCLLKKMRRAGVDECLVRWTDSFMRDRRAIMSVDGQDGEPMDVTTGLPQGSPISPALFAIYIADIHGAVEGQEGPPGTAFHAVDEYLVARAFRGTSKKKSPGPDGIGRLAIACVYEWDPGWIVALLRAHIRFGYHPAKRKVARGVTIPKPEETTTVWRSRTGASLSLIA